MMKVENVYPKYEENTMRKEKVQAAYTGIQKTLYNNEVKKNNTKGKVKNV